MTRLGYSLEAWGSHSVGGKALGVQAHKTESPCFHLTSVPILGSINSLLQPRSRPNHLFIRDPRCFLETSQLETVKTSYLALRVLCCLESY